MKEGSYLIGTAVSWWDYDLDWGSSSGEIHTYFGIVSAYHNGDVISLSFVWKGRHYRQDWDEGYSRRYATTLAKRFAKKIAQNENDQDN